MAGWKGHGKDGRSVTEWKRCGKGWKECDWM